MHLEVLARHPELFQRAVLLDPVLFTPAMIGVMALSDVVGLSQRNTLAQKARGRRCEWPDRQSAWQALHNRGMFRGWEAAAFNAYIEHALKDVEGGVALKCRPSREADLFGSFPRRLWPSLARIQTPTQVLYGERSYPFVAKSVARCCASNPYFSGQVVAGGHCFMQEFPAASAARGSFWKVARKSSSVASLSSSESTVSSESLNGMVVPLVVVRKAAGTGGKAGIARGDHPERQGVARIAVAP